MGETKGIPIKPAPDMLYMTLKDLGLNKEEVLFIGDSDVDMMTANNANIKSVAVTWGYRSKEVLLSYHPAYIIDDIYELLNIINEVNAHGND